MYGYSANFPHGPQDKSYQLHALLGHVISFLGVIVVFGLFATGHVFGLTELCLFAVFWVSTQVGVSVGFHRLFSHRSFKTNQTIKAVLAILGSMAALGHPIFWVALHRKHHRYTDQPGDPHSPYFAGEQPLGKFEGFWHAHIGWSMRFEFPDFVRYAPDLLNDTLLCKISNWYPLWVLLGLLVPMMVTGWISETWQGAFYGLLWGGLVRIWVTQQLILIITSISHIFGHQSFDSGDRSTNNIWFAIPTLGESWHNNHHTFPAAAIVGWTWWQIDIAGWFIRLLEKMGLAWDVKRVPEAVLKSMK